MNWTKKFIHELFPTTEIPFVETPKDTQNSYPFSPLDPGQYINPPDLKDPNTYYLSSPTDPLKDLYNTSTTETLLNPPNTNLPTTPTKKSSSLSVKTFNEQMPNTSIPEIEAQSTNKTEDENEYQKAIQQVLENKKNFMLADIASGISKGLIGAISGTHQSQLPKFELPTYADDLVKGPLTELEVRDKGLSTKIDLTNKQQKNDPNSEISKIYKTNVLGMLQSLGMPELAKKIQESNLSAAQLEDMFGETNLNNLFTNKLVTDRQLSALQTRMSFKEKTDDEKVDKQTFERATKLRNELFKENKDRLSAYNRFTMLRDILNQLEDAQRRGDKDTIFTQTMALTSVMKLIQQDDSVLREPDIRIVFKSTGFTENAAQEFNAALGKGLLTPKIMQNIKKFASVGRLATAKSIMNQSQPILKTAQKYNVPTDLIINDSLARDMQKADLLTKKVTKKPDGKIEVVDTGSMDFSKIKSIDSYLDE